MSLRSSVSGSLACLAVVSSLVLPSSARSAETVTLDSGTYQRLPQIIRGKPEKATVEARLVLPGGTGKAPAAVILHNCSGVGGAEDNIAAHMEKAGYATLMPDTLAARGWSGNQTCTGQALGADASQVADAYAALAFLARHPAIDPKRIVVMGASMGGASTMYTASELIREKLVGADGLKFAAHVAFYTASRWTFPASGLTGAPILNLVGANDDWTPAKREVALLEFWKKGMPTYPVELKSYPASHGWLNNSVTRYNPNWSSFAECPYILLEPGKLSALALDGSTQPITPGDRAAFQALLTKNCGKPGANIESDSDVTDRSLKDTTDFLARVLGK